MKSAEGWRWIPARVKRSPYYYPYYRPYYYPSANDGSDVQDMNEEDFTDLLDREAEKVRQTPRSKFGRRR